MGLIHVTSEDVSSSLLLSDVARAECEKNLATNTTLVRVDKVVLGTSLCIVAAGSIGGEGGQVVEVDLHQIPPCEGDAEVI